MWLDRANGQANILDTRHAQGPDCCVACPTLRAVFRLFRKSVLDDFLFGKSYKAMLPHLADLCAKLKNDVAATRKEKRLPPVHGKRSVLIDGLRWPVDGALARGGLPRFEETPEGLYPEKPSGNPGSLASVFRCFELQSWMCAAECLPYLRRAATPPRSPLRRRYGRIPASTCYARCCWPANIRE